jgi:hypothetical protein
VLSCHAAPRPKRRIRIPAMLDRNALANGNFGEAISIYRTTTFGRNGNHYPLLERRYPLTLPNRLRYGAQSTSALIEISTADECDA